MSVVEQPIRTAVYGPVRTVVWEGSGREACPYPDRVSFGDVLWRFDALGIRLGRQCRNRVLRGRASFENALIRSCVENL